MTYAYLRSMPGLPSLSEQVREVVSFAQREGITIDKEVVEYSQKDAPIDARKEFESFLRGIKEEDRLVVSALEVLSDRVEELVKVINCIFSHKATLSVARTAMHIRRESKAVEIFSLLNALREAKRERYGKIGRPKGSKSGSKFDIHQSRIIMMLKEKMSVSAIARELGVSRSSLKDYIESRALRDLVDGEWIKVFPQTQKTEHIVMICPFEQQQSQTRKVS